MRRLLVVAAGLLLVGCTTNEAGSPTAQHTTTTTTRTAAPTTTTTEATTTTTRPRPKAIDLAGVDVCQLIGKLPLGDYGLDPARPPTGGPSSAFPGAQDCFANGPAANLGLTIVAVVDQGAGEYLDGAQGDVEEAAAKGFPTYVVKTSDQAACFGVVDVNEGQLLFLNYGLNIAGEEPVTPQATLCDRIPTIAAAAITQLGG